MSSLSAYLRSSVTAQMLAVDHLSYAEFLRSLPSPTCVVSVGMRPYEGNAVLEINPSLVFPIIEILLGGNGKLGSAAIREITEIEQNVLDGLFRIVLQALAEAWKDLLPVTLTIDSVGKEARLLHAPHEPMVAMSFEIKLEDCAGHMNLAVPTEILTMQGEDGDASSAPRKIEAGEAEQLRMLNLMQNGIIHTGGAFGGAHATRARVARIEGRRCARLRSPDRSAFERIRQWQTKVRRTESSVPGNRKRFRSNSGVLPARREMLQQPETGFSGIAQATPVAEVLLDLTGDSIQQI